MQGSGSAIAARVISNASAAVAGMPDAQARNVRQECLEALRVLGAGARRHALLAADDERRRQLAARDVADVRRLVDELVERDEQEVRPHDLHDGAQALERRPERAAEDRGLRDRRVEHPLRAELLLEVARHAEDAAGGGDVLAEEHELVTGLQLELERTVHRLGDGELRQS